MGPLLRFLKRYLRFSPHLHLFEHPCSWVSVLFIEQDDDLLEAAKALLTIHLKWERLVFIFPSKSYVLFFFKSSECEIKGKDI